MKVATETLETKSDPMFHQQHHIFEKTNKSYSRNKSTLYHSICTIHTDTQRPPYLDIHHTIHTYYTHGYTFHCIRTRGQLHISRSTDTSVRAQHRAYKLHLNCRTQRSICPTSSLTCATILPLARGTSYQMITLGS